MISVKEWLPEKTSTNITYFCYAYPNYKMAELEGGYDVLLGLPAGHEPSYMELNDICEAYACWRKAEGWEEVTGNPAFYARWPGALRGIYADTFLGPQRSTLSGIDLLSRFLADFEQTCYQAKYNDINNSPVLPYSRVWGDELEDEEDFRVLGLRHELDIELLAMATKQCRDFGLLSWQEDEPLALSHEATSQITGNVSFESTINNCIHRGFTSFEYSQEMNALYALFLGWRCLMWDDREAYVRIKKHYVHLSRDVEVTKEVIEDEIRTQSLTLQCNLAVRFDNHEPERGIVVRKPVDAAKYTMLDIIAAGEPALLGGSLSFCSTCGSQFIRHRSNATLCNECKTPYAKVKASRNRKKNKAR